LFIVRGFESQRNDLQIYKSFWKEHGKVEADEAVVSSRCMDSCWFGFRVMKSGRLTLQRYIWPRMVGEMMGWTKGSCVDAQHFTVEDGLFERYHVSESISDPTDWSGESNDLRSKELEDDSGIEMLLVESGV
jgi:hypothetical protein